MLPLSRESILVGFKQVAHEYGVAPERRRCVGAIREQVTVRLLEGLEELVGLRNFAVLDELVDPRDLQSWKLAQFGERKVGDELAEAGNAAEQDQLPATGVFNDSRGILQVASQAGVLDGLHGQFVFLVPLRGPQVQRVQCVGLGALEDVLEELCKKVMVAVPGAAPAHRNDEGMLPLEPLEQVQAIDSFGQAVGEFGIESLNDGRSPEYAADVVRQILVDLLGKIVGDIAGGSGQPA